MSHHLSNSIGAFTPFPSLNVEPIFLGRSVSFAAVSRKFESQSSYRLNPWPFNEADNTARRPNFRCRRSTSLKMSVRPLEYTEAKRLLPKVGTSEQLDAFWGTTPDEKNAKFVELLMSSLAGSWASYFASFMIGKLLTRVSIAVFLFYWLLAPNIFAYQRNAGLQGNLATTKDEPGTHVALFSARIAEIRTSGRSRYSPGRKLIALTMMDSEGKKLKVQVNDLDGYENIKVGMRCEALILSEDPDFNTIQAMTDIYIPSCDTWVGEYPYLDKQRFKWLVAQNYSIQQRRIEKASASSDDVEISSQFWDTTTEKIQEKQDMFLGNPFRE